MELIRIKFNEGNTSTLVMDRLIEHPVRLFLSPVFSGMKADLENLN